MTSKNVATLLTDLNITRSHSRPHVSNDNPYSEAAFKTLKYCPVFPGTFAALDDARAFCDVFFAYYNNEHRHSGIGLHTPATVHDGTAWAIQARRQQVLDDAFAARPDRFRGRRPLAPALPAKVWINKPRTTHHRDPGDPSDKSSSLMSLSKPGARCRYCYWPVSPDFSPNPPCASQRNGLSTVPAVRLVQPPRGWGSWCRGSGTG